MMMERFRIRTAVQGGAQKLRHLKQALRIVWQASPGWTVASLGLVVIHGVLPLLTLYLIKRIVDTITLNAGTVPLAEAAGAVMPWIGLAAAVTLAGVLVRSVNTLVGEAQAHQVTDHVQEVLHAKAIEVDLQYYEDPRYRDTLHRAQHEAPYRPTRMVHALVQTVMGGISLLAIACLLLYSLHWAFGGVLLISALPGILVKLRHSKRLYEWQRQRTATERRIQYYNDMLASSHYAKEIQLFALGRLFSERSRALRTELRHQRIQIAIRRATGDCATQSAATAAMFLSFGYVAYRALQGALTLGDLVMFYQAFQRGLGYLHDTMSGLASLYENSLFLSNLHEFLAVAPTVPEPRQPKALPTRPRHGLAFEKVSFQYPSGSRPVLVDINFKIPVGGVLALVGENGAGKSTLIRLLCRLYDPTAGRVTLDGTDIRDFPKSEWRRQISPVFQDYAQYFLSARENIQFGDVGRSDSSEAVERAARQAGADAMIRRLPHGYDTVLGRLFEKGEELSIGQWQKIALARAFLREAPILVLDEPASALDALAEEDVFRKFRKLLAGRTAVVISHRLASVRMADRILVLREGRIVETGTHGELIRLGGDYACLFESQAKNYR